MTPTIARRLQVLETRAGHRCLECELAALNGPGSEPCHHAPGALLMDALQALNRNTARRTDADD